MRSTTLASRRSGSGAALVPGEQHRLSGRGPGRRSHRNRPFNPDQSLAGINESGLWWKYFINFSTTPSFFFHCVRAGLVIAFTLIVLYRIRNWSFSDYIIFKSKSEKLVISLDALIITSKALEDYFSDYTEKTYKSSCNTSQNKRGVLYK